MQPYPVCDVSTDFAFFRSSTVVFAVMECELGACATPAIENRDAWVLNNPGMSSNWNDLAALGSVRTNTSDYQHWKEDSQYNQADQGRKDALGTVVVCPKCAADGTACPGILTSWVHDGKVNVPLPSLPFF